MTRIIAITNQKGGVGKTTTASNLAGALTSKGRRCLLVDLAPQALLTASLGIFDYKTNSTGEVEYTALADEVIKQEA